MDRRRDAAAASRSSLGDGSATGYSIDSRTIAPRRVVLRGRGERFDGHDFVEAALVRGAGAAVVSKDKLDSLPESVQQGDLLVVADDPLLALQRLAAAVRKHWGGRVVAITGSAGKTTTKEAVAAVLAARFRVLKSEGNLNNGFGLPLQLLRLEAEHEVAVIEMGMSHAGEIAALAKIAAPNWGVVTNVGWAHAENFPDGISGIARAKYELIEALPPDGVAFLNCGDRLCFAVWPGFFGEDDLLWLRALRRASCRRCCRAGAGRQPFPRGCRRGVGDGAAGDDGPAQCHQCDGGDCGGA